MASAPEASLVLTVRTPQNDSRLRRPSSTLPSSVRRRCNPSSRWRTSAADPIEDCRLYTIYSLGHLSLAASTRFAHLRSTMGPSAGRKDSTDGKFPPGGPTAKGDTSS